jgi:exopolyphosphatase/pppGpp-phosphohydrolase
VVVLNLLEVFSLKTLMVIDSGLLEGILLDGLERMTASKEQRVRP